MVGWEHTHTHTRYAPPRCQNARQIARRGTMQNARRNATSKWSMVKCGNGWSTPWRETTPIYIPGKHKHMTNNSIISSIYPHLCTHCHIPVTSIRQYIHINNKKESTHTWTNQQTLPSSRSYCLRLVYRCCSHRSYWWAVFSSPNRFGVDLLACGA